MNFAQYAEMIIKGLVKAPHDVIIEQFADEKGVLLVCRVNPADMGRLIGKAGATAKALRALLHTHGSLNGALVSLKIEEPEVRAAKTWTPPREDVKKNSVPVDIVALEHSLAHLDD